VILQPPAPPVTPPRQVFSHGLENTETASTPTLDSLRKLSQHLEIDNAKRANRLSFGFSPMRPQAPQYRGSFGGTSSRPTLDPIASQRDAEDAADTAEQDDEETDGSSDAEGDENVPPSPTPSLRDSSTSTPLRSAPLTSGVGRNTPSFTGFRNLFAQTAKPPPTPSFVGVRQLFHGTIGSQPAGEPPTPNFSGVSDMFALPEQDEARDATPKPLPRRFVTPARNSTRSSATTNGLARAENLLPVPTRGSRSRSRSRSAALQSTSEGAAGSRPPSRQSGTKAPEPDIARGEPPASKSSSSSRHSANEGTHVSRSSQRRMPVARPVAPDPKPDTQEKKAEPAASQLKRPRTPRAVEVMIITRSPKISPSHIGTTRAQAASGSKRAHASDTEEDGKAVAFSRVTRSSERNRSEAVILAETAEDANPAPSEEPASTEKLTGSPSSGQTRKRARSLKEATPENAPVVQTSTSPKRGTRLPVRRGRGRGLSRGGAAVSSGARRRAPPHDRNEVAEEPEPEPENKEAPVISSGTGSSAKAVASVSKTSKTTPTVSATTATNVATPASGPAPVTRSLRTRSAGKK
jgi:hypothetical protein